MRSQGRSGGVGGGGTCHDQGCCMHHSRARPPAAGCVSITTPMCTPCPTRTWAVPALCRQRGHHRPAEQPPEHPLCAHRHQQAPGLACHSRGSALAKRSRWQQRRRHPQQRTRALDARPAPAQGPIRHSRCWRRWQQRGAGMAKAGCERAGCGAAGCIGAAAGDVLPAAACATSGSGGRGSGACSSSHRRPWQRG